MDDLDILATDFRFGTRGKSNPMRSNLVDNPRPASRSSIDDPLFNDVFGGPTKYFPSPNFSVYSNNKKLSVSDVDHDSIFKSSEPNDSNSSNAFSLPLYDKPVYDEDMFDVLPGLKSGPASSSVKLDDDVFASISSPPSNKSRNLHDDFSDLLGNLGRNEKVGEDRISNSTKSSSGSQGFEDLLDGFGGGSSATRNQGTSPATGSKNRSNVVDDPFVVMESTSTMGSSSSKLFADSLEDLGKLGNMSAGTTTSSDGGGAFNDLDPLNKFGKLGSSFPPKRDSVVQNLSSSIATPKSTTTNELKGNSSSRYFESKVENRVHATNDDEPTSSDVPNVNSDFRKFSVQAASSLLHDETRSHVDPRHPLKENGQQFDEEWLTVSDITLFTQPTKAPPPSRPAPSIPEWISRLEAGSFSSSSVKEEEDFFSPSSYSHYYQSTKSTQPSAKDTQVSQFGELENFAKGLSQNNVDESNSISSNEETVVASAAAVMKEAMDKAEAKFRHAKEIRETENATSIKNKESVHMEKDEQDEHGNELREAHERLEHEQNQKELEERMRLEREKCRERDKQIEREKARLAVERATREARERAAAEARERAASDARLRNERAAVQRAQAEARERAAAEAIERAQKVAKEARERAAAAEAKERAEKAASEARERAAAEAKEKAEKTAAEARERAAAAEAKEKEFADKAKAEAVAKRRNERAAFERAAAEARERAAAEAKEKAAAAAKENQQKYDNDLDSFFGMGRASSAPRTRTDSTDDMFNHQFQSKQAAKDTPATSGVSSSNMKKASSSSSIVDDLSSIFGASSSSGVFQEVEGETEERKKFRLDRHLRTQERAAKALAEKNQRDIQAQRDQEERHRFAETLDIEIKRWAAGKEGNLRALLSNLQYVLWPECGWQPVSITDLIMGASVKKYYRKATLCIHPDKVQQKGATLQQKYISEKVFDLLKEAWNKFNSEELF